MGRPFGLVKAEARKGRMVPGQFDPRLKLDRSLAAAAGKIFDRLHQPSANALSLTSRRDGELADIIFRPLLKGKNAADDLVAVERHEAGLSPRLVPQSVGGQQVC